jgi:hypothetical protein
MKRILQKLLEGIFGRMLECQCTYCKGIRHAQASAGHRSDAYQQVA